MSSSARCSPSPPTELLGADTGREDEPAAEGVAAAAFPPAAASGATLGLADTGESFEDSGAVAVDDVDVEVGAGAGAGTTGSAVC